MKLQYQLTHYNKETISTNTLQQRNNTTKQILLTVSYNTVQGIHTLMKWLIKTITEPEPQRMVLLNYGQLYIKYNY